MRKSLAIFLLCLVVVGAAIAQKSKKGGSHRAVVASGLPAGAAAAMHDVIDDHIRTDIKFLSSDLLEGRGTGARGGDIAANYVATQFELAGLTPLGDKGTFLQDVPMVGIATQPNSSLSVTTPKETLNLRQLDDTVIMDESQKPVSDIDSDVLFIGYGITAPEYNWDDYAGANVKGKVLLMLVNEPPSSDDKFFAGKALTYYGRWTYKYEHAAKMGAAGVILIHKTDMASYGWEVVRSSWSGERSYLRGDSNPKLSLAAWVQLEVARKMLADSGKNLDELITAAQQRGFKAMPLPIKVRAHVVSKVRPFDSYNVIGQVPGSDPKLKSEAVIITAHYDHLGIRPEMKGDNIYNGALDNASGTAMVIEMARAAAASPNKPKRSIIFAAVTGEEQGLLGSEFLGKHPPVPDSNISLNLNFDSVAPLGIPKETSAGGYDRTSFAPIFEKTAADFGMKIRPPQHPESGGYYRSDHFSFARVGVPAFSVNTGGKFEGHPEEWVKQRQAQYGKNYHQVTDEFQPDGDYRTDAVMARFGLALAWKAADLPTLVQWKPGDEFEAARKAEVGH
jgi:Zn-dependent M28 family amino/carboxypeptidase